MMGVRLTALLALSLLLLPAFSGCFDALDVLTRPDYSVASTPLEVGDTKWNTENRFRVVVDEGKQIVITARNQATDQVVQESGMGDVTLVIPDGIWTVSYTVDGYDWQTLSPVRVDATAPEIAGLEFVGNADASGSYTIGRNANVEPGATVTVSDGETGTRLGSQLPHRLTGLGDGLHVFLVQATDAAGNVFSRSVQVRVGGAAELPEGKFTFGVVARYTNEARVWDMTDLAAYASVTEARGATGGDHLGAGFGIDPDSACVRQVVDGLITPSMTTAQRAMTIFQWLYENLEYDETRLTTDTLLQPCQVIGDTEDPNDTDPDKDGLVGNGSGNGVRGGICRDLAATYVSLLRAADVPARLVSGYLAGNVNGFHAWVEFYGGRVNGMDPWIPVDVSIIDGPYDEGSMLQSFGIQLPEYLALRKVPHSSEIEGWATALSVGTRWTTNSRQPDERPDVKFEKDVTPIFENTGALCVNTATRARLLADNPEGCTANAYTSFIRDFVVRTERIIDYGIHVKSAPKGTDVSAEVAYPFPESVNPDDVSFIHYGPAFTKDLAKGKAVTEFTWSG